MFVQKIFFFMINYGKKWEDISLGSFIIYGCNSMYLWFRCRHKILIIFFSVQSIINDIRIVLFSGFFLFFSVNVVWVGRCHIKYIRWPLSYFWYFFVRIFIFICQKFCENVRKKCVWLWMGGNLSVSRENSELIFHCRRFLRVIVFYLIMDHHYVFLDIIKENENFRLKIWNC